MGAGSPSPSGKQRRRAPRALGALLLLLLLLGLLAVAAWRTETGARAVWALAERALPGRIGGTVSGGTLADGLELRGVVYRDEARLVKIDRVRTRWRWSLAPRALDVDALQAGTIDLTTFPTPPQPKQPPAQLRVPLGLHVRNAALDRLVVHPSDAAGIAIDGIRFALDTDGAHHAVTLHNADTPYGKLQAALKLDGSQPFAMNGNASLAGAWRDMPYRLDARLAGSLVEPDIRLAAQGGAMRGQATVLAAPFAPVPLRRLQATLNHLDPRLFAAGMPQADLALDADLAPAQNASSALRLQGPVALRNAQAGAWDKGLLPLVSATARIVLDAQHQEISALRLVVPGGGSAEGGGAMAGGAGRLDLQVRTLDPHALHGALKPERLNGPLHAELDGGTQRLQAQLEGKTIALAARLEMTPQELNLQQASLRARGAALTLAGTLGRTGARAFAARGHLDGFNPADFLDRSRANLQGRINAAFDAQGALQPELAARVRFDIRDDSRYAGLPLAGGGHVQLAGKRIADSDARLDVAGNHVRLRGGFGAPGSRLRFDVDAPALQRLGMGLSGLLQASGTLGGTPDQPAVDADVQARQLAFGEYRVGTLAGKLRAQGMPERNPAAPVGIDLDVRDLQLPDVRIGSATLAVSGSYGSHELRLSADGRVRGQALALEAAARGRLAHAAAGYGWEGTVERLSNAGVPRFALAIPLTVNAAPGRVLLGATRLTLEQSALALDHFRLDAQGISTAGSIAALDLNRLLALQRELTGSAPPVKTNLVIDGRWDLALADSARGFFEFARRSGDIRVLEEPRETALGLETLRLRGDLQGRTATVAADVQAQRIGGATVRGEIGLEPQNGIVLPTAASSLAARIRTTLPRLQSLAALAGPRLEFTGSVGGDFTAAGTLGAPSLSGDIAGSGLAITLFDQGVRLHDGILQVHVADNVAELQRLEFHGGAGTLRATGRVLLAAGIPDIHADVVADRLQLLANPSGRLTLSGSATVNNPDGALQVNGKFRVDQARFARPEQSAPALGDDVTVVRGDRRSAPPKQRPPGPGEKPASPYSPRIDIGVDLGDDFRFAGLGADLLLAGGLRIESAPGATPQAFGTIRVASGTFEAFGAKLGIEHGVLDFTGPFANPTLNLLAMRRNQDVAAGVQVSGTAKQPRLQLVSEPDVPEEEKLSWLVFGHGTSAGDAGAGSLGAQAAARTAALGLLNNLGGNRIAKGLGLDQLSIGSSEYGLGTQQVVSLGKEISDRLVIGYEQSLAGAAGVLKLTYEISRNWSVVLRGGVVAGLDMFYSRRFDTRARAAEKH